MTQYVTVEQFGEKSQGLGWGKVFEPHQKMIVVKGDLVLERSRAEVVTAACLFAQMHQICFRVVPNYLPCLAQAQAKVRLFPHGTAPEALIKPVLLK